MSVNPTEEQIRLYAKQLKLPTFTRYPDILRKARPNTCFDKLLLELMKAQTEQRQENQNRKRLRIAGFPYTKTLEELDLSRYDGNLSDLFLGELASCKFISEKERGHDRQSRPRQNAYGHRVCLKACALGMSVLFKNAATLSTELTEAKDNYVLGKLEKRLRQADLLILDEMSYLSFDRFQSELLFKAIFDRNERGSVIVTTNLPFSQWTELFVNTAMVAALVDRLMFKPYILDMSGDSYRFDQTLKTTHS